MDFSLPHIPAVQRQKVRARWSLAAAMELEKEHFRAMILYDFKSGLNETRSLERLQQAFGDLASSRATNFRWFQEFKRDRTSLKDDERSERPAIAVTEENIAAVEKMVREINRATFKDIEAVL